MKILLKKFVVVLFVCFGSLPNLWAAIPFGIVLEVKGKSFIVQENSQNSESHIALSLGDQVYLEQTLLIQEEKEGGEGYLILFDSSQRIRKYKKGEYRLKKDSSPSSFFSVVGKRIGEFFLPSGLTTTPKGTRNSLARNDHLCIDEIMDTPRAEYNYRLNKKFFKPEWLQKCVEKSNSDMQQGPIPKLESQGVHIPFTSLYFQPPHNIQQVDSDHTRKVDFLLQKERWQFIGPKFCERISNLSSVSTNQSSSILFWPNEEKDSFYSFTLASSSCKKHVLQKLRKLKKHWPDPQNPVSIWKTADLYKSHGFYYQALLHLEKLEGVDMRIDN